MHQMIILVTLLGSGKLVAIVASQAMLWHCLGTAIWLIAGDKCQTKQVHQIYPNLPTHRSQVQI